MENFTTLTDKQLAELLAGSAAYKHGQPYDTRKPFPWREGWLGARDYAEAEDAASRQPTERMDDFAMSRRVRA